MIQTDIPEIALGYTGGTFSPTVYYENSTYGGVTPPSCPDWITYENIGGAQEDTTYVESYRFTVAENTGATRYGTIALQCQDTSGETWHQTISVYQGTGEKVETSIWRDTFYYAEGVDTFVYSIKKDGVAVYFGKAYCRPGDGGAYVQVNKICQNYLKQVLGDYRGVLSQVIENVGGYGDFSICDKYGAEVMNYRFLYDWFGDWEGEGEYIMTTHIGGTGAINGHLDPRMYLMHTEYNTAETEVSVVIDDNPDGGGGGGFKEILNVVPSAITVVANAGATEFLVESNLNWDVISYSGDFTVTGKTGSKFMLKYGQNNSANERSGYAIVRNIGGQLTKRVDITQLGIGSIIDPTGNTIPDNVILVEDWSSSKLAQFDEAYPNQWHHHWSLPMAREVGSGYEGAALRIANGFGAEYVGYQMDLQWKPTEWIDSSGNPMTLTALIFDGPITSIPDWEFVSAAGESEAFIDRIAGCYCLWGLLGIGGVVLPNTVTRIGSQSIINDGYIEWPSGVTEVAEAGCYGTPNAFTTLNVPNSITTIGNRGFSQLYRSDRVEVTGSNTTVLTVPSSVTSLGSDVFSGMRNLTAVTFNANVTALPESTFQECFNLYSVTLRNTITSIGARAFAQCGSLLSITLPSGLTSIGKYAFSMIGYYSSIGINTSPHSTAGLVSVSIPSGVATIGELAFANCAMSAITVPSSVTSIGGGAFQMSGLTDIYCYATTAPTLVSATSVSMNVGLYGGSAKSPIWAYREASNGAWTIPNVTIHIPAGADYSSWQALPPMNSMTFVDDL